MSEEARAIIAEIEQAFAGVTREGGLSWHESIAIDLYSTTEEERRAYREQDTETTWTELSDDPNWDVEMGVGGFSFLDPIAFRYYLAPAMVVAAKGGDWESLNFHLRLPKDSLRDYTLSQWSLLDERQRSCVRHFIEFMIRTRGGGSEWWDEESRKLWQRALNGYWKDM